MEIMIIQVSVKKLDGFPGSYLKQVDDPSSNGFLLLVISFCVQYINNEEIEFVP